MNKKYLSIANILLFVILICVQLLFPWFFGILKVSFFWWFLLELVVLLPFISGFMIIFKNYPQTSSGSCLDLEQLQEIEASVENSELSSEDLVGGLVHELRKPLSRLQLKLGDLPEELLELNKTIKLVENVFSSEDFSPEWISFPRLFESLNKEISSPAQIKYKIETEWLKCDRKQFKLALKNLIRNSLQAYEEEEGEVVIRAFESGPEWCIRICDEAGGINEKLARTIGSAGRVEEARGMGLGLMLVKKICKNHGGRLLIESEEGVGTEVTITLPWPVE